MEGGKPYHHLIGEHFLFTTIVLSSHGKPAYRTGFLARIEPPIDAHPVKLMQARKNTCVLPLLL
jgi:hypothetical protein